MPEVHTIIPAGGLGSRMDPHTVERPKPLLPMNNDKLIDGAVKIASETVSTIATVYQHAAQVEGYLEHKAADVRVLRDVRLSGSAGSLIEHSRVLAEVSMNDIFLILPADHVTEGLNVSEFAQAHVGSGADVTAFVVSPKPYGEYVSVGPDRISGLVGYRPDAVSTTGIFMISARFMMDWISRHSRFDSDFNINGDIVHEAIARGRASAYRPDGVYWDDAGTPLRYLQNNLRLSGGENVVEESLSLVEGSIATNSVFIGKVVIDRSIELDWAIVSESQDGVNLTVVGSN